jgi:hypothetical protein
MVGDDPQTDIAKSPFEDALSKVREGDGIDIGVGTKAAEVDARLEVGKGWTIGASVKKVYDGALSAFGFASWRPRKR